MPKKKKTRGPKPAPAKPAAKHQTKQVQLLALLRRSQGVTIDQAAKALAWQPHSVRGVISGVLKKRLGLTVTSAKSEAGRVYRIAAGEAGKRP
jgi:predicted ArsR family transcriptional regulator